MDGREARQQAAEVVADPQRVEALSEEALPEVLAALESVRARVWAELSRPPEPDGPEPAARESDRMLKVDEAAEILDVKPRWLYDRSEELPFARKLAPQTLRFSERGLYRWLETRR